MYSRRCLCLIFGSALASAAMYVQPCSANIFDDAWNVVTDPLKLKEGSDSLYRSLIQLQQLEGVANNHVKERLDQIRGIFLETESKISADMNSLESKINEDANNLLLRAQCAVTDMLEVEIKDAVSKALQAVSESNPELIIMGHKVDSLVLLQVPITDPSDYYYATRDAALFNLDNTFKETDPAYIIYDTYQRIERLAEFTCCSYLKQPLKQLEFVKEANEMELLSLPWKVAVNVTH